MVCRPEETSVMKRAIRRRRHLAGLCIAIAACFVAAAPTWAAPISDFTVSSSNLLVGESATFTFTGSCDVPPCRITWRYFTDSGSHLGASMGEGPEITFAFGHSGNYAVVAKITNATLIHGSASATHGVQVREVFGDQDRSVGYDGWRGIGDAAASGGGYRAASTASPRVSFAFSGTTVRYVARSGPDRGVATISIDGVKAARLNLYAATPGVRARAFTGLAAGRHRIVIRPSGSKDARSTGTGITLDEFTVGTSHFDDTSRAVTYDGWKLVSADEADGAAARSTLVAGATTTLAFTGTKVTWVTSTGPDQGRAAITIDGRSVATVDNYSAVRLWQVQRVFSGLAYGRHTVVVKVLGTRNGHSTSTWIVSDGFVVV
jgi:hypothetical protein